MFSIVFCVVYSDERQYVHLPASQTSHSQRCVTMTSDDGVKVDIVRIIDKRVVTEPCDDISGSLLGFVVVAVVVVVDVVVVVVMRPV